MANKKNRKGEGKQKFAATDLRKTEELERAQQASLNIMEDLEKRKKELEEREIAYKNIVEDLDRAYKELQASMEREKKLAAAAATAEADRKRAAELEKAYKELEKSDKELKETTAQLIQSEKLTSLGELTAGVAHELNQPLNSIKIISQDILRDIEKNRLDQKGLHKDLSQIVTQVNKMAEIIDHMRVFTRRTEGFPKELIDITEPLEGVFKLYGQQLKVRNIEVIKEIQSGLPGVKADPIRLEQVFMNLITNARNAVESFRTEGRRIHIKAQASPDKRYIEVLVTDNGGGIPEHLQTKIFEPFFTTMPQGQGTGLGLSVTKKIVEEHGGKIELESKEGQGSTFKVILPVAEI